MTVTMTATVHVTVTVQGRRDGGLSDVNNGRLYVNVQIILGRKNSRIYNTDSTAG